METVNEDMYLGDLISNDGKNKKNVAKRVSKGLGIITQIINFLGVLSFGHNFIEIALMLRESMFINGILFNAEIWYGLTKAEIKEFEDLDKLLIRKILQAPISTPEEAFFLELGIMPISVTIKARRIKYLHYLINLEDKEMLYQFFIVQWNNPTKGDWTETVKVDMADFEIPINFESLKSKSKNAFKQLVKRKAEEYALKTLLKKQSKHSKMKNISYSKLKIQSYFSLPGIQQEEMRKTFQFRVRMAPFGENFKGKGSVSCPLCETHLDDQALCFQCPILLKKVEIKCSMEDIYIDEIKIETAQTVVKVLKTRHKLIMDGKLKESQMKDLGNKKKI